ncbi:MAG: hypothetical protein EU549_00115 [Promethearchaeota archaeon]|nr:MAG: hypothetical protein EU549_00115 [Candidatus Lokiarchaeota archaeon]
MLQIDDNLIRQLLYSELRADLLQKISNSLQKIASSLEINYIELLLDDSRFIPIIFHKKTNPASPFILIQGAQHNEYNGTFGIIKFLYSKQSESLLRWCEITGGGFCIIPILNVRGFLNPTKENKWGYFTKRPEYMKKDKIKINTNRYWDKTIDYEILNNSKSELPEENRLIGNFLLKLRKVKKNPRSQFIILDFHETSLPYRFRKQMELRFNRDYSIKDHWLKRWILDTALLYKGIPFTTKITKQVVELVKNALYELNKEIDEKTFYFLLYTPYSGSFAKYVSDKVEMQFKSRLWFSTKYYFYHKYPLNGCYCTANMNRPWLKALEIEARKIFFNLQEEREKFEGMKSYKQYLINHLTLNSEIASKIIQSSIEYLQKDYKF